MPIPESVQLELAKALTVAASHAGEIVVALPAVIAAVAAWRGGRNAKKAVKKAQESVDVTVAQTAKLDALHDDVRNLPSTPAVVAPVIVQTPQPSQPENP